MIGYDAVIGKIIKGCIVESKVTGAYEELPPKFISRLTVVTIYTNIIFNLIINSNILKCNYLLSISLFHGLVLTLYQY